MKNHDNYRFNIDTSVLLRRNQNWRACETSLFTSNETGPAIRKWNNEGVLVEEEYYLNNINDDAKEIIEKQILEKNITFNNLNFKKVKI
jgi:regulatory protein YycI of two-component signal transduction system YycFG